MSNYSRLVYSFPYVTALAVRPNFFAASHPATLLAVFLFDLVPTPNSIPSTRQVILYTNP